MVGVVSMPFRSTMKHSTLQMFELHFFMFLKEVSYGHQCCIYLMHLLVILWNITISIKFIVNLHFFDGKAEFSALLLSCHMILQKSFW